jgi:GT2 family glycosyltransferase
LKPELSIILPTCNRAALLEKCLTSITAGVKCEHEIIVVDGASTDQTADVLVDASRKLAKDRLRVIREPKREGFVKAANKGFRSARGRNMIWINDDARPVPGALDTAIEQLDDEPETVAFVALFHRFNSTRNIAYESEHRGQKYRLCHVRGTLYANFPMGRRETYERLGYFDERFFICGADPDLSLKAWYAGMSIVPGWNAMIDHDEIDDPRRATDANRADLDNRALFAKWDMPAKSPLRNEFDPKHPCSLRTLRQVLDCQVAA